MSKIDITPITLPLGLGKVDKIEIRVNYSIGDETTTLSVHYFNGSYEITQASPKLIAVPPEVMASWGYNFQKIIDWTLEQISDETPVEIQS